MTLPVMPHGPRKLKVATVSLAGCFGCHMSFLDIDERLFQLLEHIEFDRSPLTDVKQVGHCDIGLIEGGLCNAENVIVLREFRAHCKTLLQMLFVEGNHFCPSCEKSGNCLLQATAYQMGMEGPHFEEFYPDRPVDASHPDILLDFNRCILCELCVRASRDVDSKNVFAIGGHGIGTRLLVNSASGRLGDTDMALADRAANICPVGVILPKRRGFAVPIGKRVFDLKPISAPGVQGGSQVT